MSALGGGLLIAFVDQARDLFADTGLLWSDWLVFFVGLFLWAWLVHGMARRALQFDEWIPEAHVPGGVSGFDRAELRKPFYGIAVWVPRMLGSAVFIATAWALWLTRLNLLPATGLKQAEDAVWRIWVLLFLTVLTGAGYLAFVLVWRRLRARLKRRDKKQPLLIEEPLLIGEQSVLVLGWRAALHPRTDGPAFLALFSTWLNRGLIAAAIVVTALFVIALVQPDYLSDRFPRVMFLPLLLGGAVLLLGEIASLSHRYATPLLVCFFVLGAFMGMRLKHYNDVRWVAPAPASPVNGTRHQLGFAEAIERWRTDNCQAPNPCPRPIVIAGAGGASRAGFYTASVVGAMIDAGAIDKDLSNIRSRIFAISTVSGSSVGAVMMRAAWMDALEKNSLHKPPCKPEGTTAWFNGKTRGGSSSWRDCFQQLMAGDFLSPVFVGLTYRDMFPLGGEDRSGLLEQSFERWYREITDGKAAACAKGDYTGLCRPIGHLPDRLDPQKAGDWIPLLFVNGTSVATGRRVIVSDVRIGCIVGKDDNKDRWFLDLAYDYREMRDLTARRIDQCSTPIDEPKGQDIDMRLSTVAMMSARFPLVSTQGVIRDVKGTIVDSVVDGGYFENEGLATAADIVRELQNSKLKPIVIRIVNEPDTKLADIPMLKGLLPQDANETEKLKNEAEQKQRLLELSGKSKRDGELQSIRPPLPKSEERTLFDVYTSIGRALYATRSGHEDGHLAYLRATLDGPLVRIGVDAIDDPSRPDPAKPAPPSKTARDLFCRSPVPTSTAMNFVSMSWWMSQPVQAYLDAQLCRPQIERLMCVLKLKENEGYQKDDKTEPCG